MLGSWQLKLSLQIATVAIPVALYFLILGLLNSQRKPQILSERLDLSLLLAAFSPLYLTPLLRWIGAPPVGVFITVAIMIGGIALAAPGAKRGWVVYNISTKKLLQSLSRSLRRANLPFERRGDEFLLEMGPRIRISPFPLLRNVSIAIEGVDEAHRPAVQRFEAELRRGLGQVEVTASPMAASFVLIATAMIVVPLVFMAGRMPEMVRLLTDMVR